MPCSKMLRKAAQNLPAFRNAAGQLDLLNAFDTCLEHDRRVRSCCKLVQAKCHIMEVSCDSYTGTGHEPCKGRCVDFDPEDDLEWLQANDPRFQENYWQLTDFAKFGRLFQFHSLCMDNLMQMFKLGGVKTMIERSSSSMTGVSPWYGEFAWVEAMNELSLKSARHHNLVTDIATLLAAYDDLDTRPTWFRDIFVGFRGGYFFSESAFSCVFSSKMEMMYDLANSNKVLIIFKFRMFELKQGAHNIQVSHV
jgi:hypothetical protein